MAEEFLQSMGNQSDIGFRTIDVVPGDDVTAEVTGFRKKIEIGAGLEQRGQRVFCSIPGVLRYRAPAHYWVHDVNRKQYCPLEGDQVVGIIEDRSGEAYKVNVFSGSTALLPQLAFEGASKRNKPELRKGDLVYCRVSHCHKDLDLELSCLSVSGVKKDWSSGEATYDALKEGIILRVPIAYAYRLLRPDCAVLAALGRHTAYEIAVGMNGVVWVKANLPVHAILVRNAIENAEHVTDDTQVVAMVELLVDRSQRM